MSTHCLGVEVALLVHVVLNPVVRRHIVNVITAVEVVEALVCGQILTVVAEIPLADAARVVARRLQYFRKSDFIAQNSVDVVEELIGIEEVRRRPRIGLNIAWEHHVVEVSARGVSAREDGESRRRAHGGCGIEVVHHDSAVRDGVDVGSVDGCVFGVGYRAACRAYFVCEIAVCRDIAVRHIVHQNYEHVGLVLRRVFVFDACKIVVVSRLQTLNGWTAAQVHEENVHYRRAYHKERAYRASDFESGFLCDKLVGHINQRGKQHGEEHKHQIVPKVLPKLSAPQMRKNTKRPHMHTI